ncbi:TetR/AcrR family transcriptional regulator [Jannaschia sp. M317]|uniref:TetR/AcrR family transcriptional regulator n=1 Tax=Jannaschia sp. M317 TaxID=2867011 RepID=UPI0021A88E53|nr:TetR family transcriptional regulator [Jannaschia sp. M317]UWQ17756.1 TetR family transcriptional regulator [Jannaschia sp. M317]
MSKAQLKSRDAPNETVEKILVAAEVEFSERGFDGAGMKAISARADVSQALLHYHFGNKDRLYDEVIERRSDMINSERRTLLAAVDPDAPDALDGILAALFRPPLGPSGGQHAYARIFSNLVVGRERERALVRRCYDPTARTFIEAICRATPGTDQATAAMAYTLSLGALIAVIGRDGRVERLMGRDDIQTQDQILAQLVRFTKGGVLALTGTG